jgi:hypothetical protein
MQMLETGGKVVVGAFSTLPASRRVLLACTALTAAGLLPIVGVAQDQAEYLGPHFPYSRYDALPTSVIESGGGKIEVAFAPGHLGQQRSPFR